MYQPQLHSDDDELKKRLLDAWHDVMDQSVTDDAIDEWRECLRARVQAKGGHFDHCKLYNSIVCRTI